MIDIITLLKAIGVIIAIIPWVVIVAAFMLVAIGEIIDARRTRAG